jgi:hypothetical protein
MEGVKRTSGTFSILTALGLLALAAPTHATNPNPGVAPPHSSSHGHTYGGWSAEWWRWFLSLPVDEHPALGADCNNGQSGQVFFIAADFTGGSSVDCTIPPGKAIFFPIINAECSTVEPPPFFGADEEELRACAECWTDVVVVDSLEVTLDDEALEDLGSYRAASPLFTFDYPEGNIFGLPGSGSAESVSDGYWILLHPLSAGEHVLSFSGEACFPTGAERGAGLDPGTCFGFGASYVLTVEGGD